MGAILASAVVFGVYHEALLDFEEKNGNADGDYFLTPKTAGIWATYPEDFLTHQGGLADQIVSTGWSNLWAVFSTLRGGREGLRLSGSRLLAASSCGRRVHAT